MSHHSSRGASYLVRRLKGKGAVHFAAPTAAASGSSSKNGVVASSFSTGARLAFLEQVAQSGVNIAGQGAANVAGTVVEWPQAAIESPITQNGNKPYTGHRANQRQHSGTGHGPAASLLPSFWIQPPASSTTSPALFAATSSVKSLAASASASTSSASSSSTSSSSSTLQAKEQGIRIPPRPANATNTHLTLHHGAFGIPKRSKVKSVKGKEREELDPEDSVQKQISELEGPLLSVQVGEDAYFVRHDSLGVADGVGGWSGRKGADPGLFATRLMHHCSAGIGKGETSQADSSRTSSSTKTASSSTNRLSFVSSSTSSASNSGSSANLHTSSTEDSTPSISKVTSGRHPVEGDPIEILHRAWDLTLTEFFDLELIGSSTALIALLKDDELRLANLGDCSCSIVRESEYIFRSQEQQHSFNYPFQMGTNSQDTPRKDGQRFTIKVQKNDIVILASDGLVDNLFDEDILEEVEKFTDNPQQLSQALCARAKAVSEDQRAVTSPFQQRANEEGIHFVGGKHDDISVLVAVIGDAAQE